MSNGANIGMDHITYSSNIIECAELMGSTKNKSPFLHVLLILLARAEYRIHICLHHVDRKIRFLPHLFATLCSLLFGSYAWMERTRMSHIRDRWKLKKYRKKLLMSYVSWIVSTTTNIAMVSRGKPPCQ